MTDLVLQGNATDFGKPFPHGDEVWVLKSGCFDRSLRSGHDVKLLMNHDPEHCFGSGSDRLMLHAGKTALVFRYLISNSKHNKFFEDVANDLETYLPVSIGFERTKSETTQVDGMTVVTVIEARLDEVSVLNKAPAVHSTYARVASWDTCGSLKDDYEAGRFDLVGRYVSLHRAVKAQENGGKVDYRNTTTPYERAADRFSTALRKLQ
jgi:HK97 family phage prohead protease